MIEKDSIFNLLEPIKGWPAHEAQNLEAASHMILGSPFWDIPEDTYKIIDRNETYSLIAVYRNGKISWENRYLVVNMKLTDYVKPVSGETPPLH